MMVDQGVRVVLKFCIYRNYTYTKLNKPSQASPNHGSTALVRGDPHAAPVCCDPPAAPGCCTPSCCTDPVCGAQLLEDGWQETAKEAESNPAPSVPKGVLKDVSRLSFPIPGKKKTSEKDKATIKKKKFAVEVGPDRDDMGNDLSGLGNETDDDTTKANPPSACSNYAFGSGVYYGSNFPKEKPYARALHCLDMKDLDVYVNLLPPKSHNHIDFVEMCGGMGGVLKLTSSRNLVGGEHFDLRCNWNLLNPSHRKAFWQ